MGYERVLRVEDAANGSGPHPDHSQHSSRHSMLGSVREKDLILQKGASIRSFDLCRCEPRDDEPVLDSTTEVDMGSRPTVAAHYMLIGELCRDLFTYFEALYRYARTDGALDL